MNLLANIRLYKENMTQYNFMLHEPDAAAWLSLETAVCPSPLEGAAFRGASERKDLV